MDPTKRINIDRYDPFDLDMIDSVCSGYMITENPLEKEVLKSVPSETTKYKQVQGEMESLNPSTDDMEVMADNITVNAKNIDNKNNKVWSIKTNMGDVVCIGCTIIIVILLLSILVYFICKDNE